MTETPFCIVAAFGSDGVVLASERVDGATTAEVVEKRERVAESYRRTLRKNNGDRDIDIGFTWGGKQR